MRKNKQRFASFFMLFLMLVTVFQPAMIFAADSDLDEEDAKEIIEQMQDDSIDVVQVENEVEEVTEEIGKVEETDEEEIVQEEKEPIKNKGDPVVNEEVDASKEDPKKEESELKEEMKKEVKKEVIEQVNETNETNETSTLSNNYNQKEIKLIFEVSEHELDHSSFSDYHPKYAEGKTETFYIKRGGKTEVVRPVLIKKGNIYEATISVPFDKEMFGEHDEIIYEWYESDAGTWKDPYDHSHATQLNSYYALVEDSNMLKITKDNFDEMLNQDIEFKRVLKRTSSNINVNLKRDVDLDNKITVSEDSCPAPAPSSLSKTKDNSDAAKLSGASFEITDSKGNKMKNESGDTTFITDSSGNIKLNLFSKETFTIKQLTDVNGVPVDQLINNDLKPINPSLLRADFKTQNAKEGENCLSIDVFNNSQSYNPEFLDIPVSKKWNAINKFDLTVYPYANGVQLSDKAINLNEENNWSNTITDLPKYDAEGKEIEYSIKENIHSGYTGIKFDVDVTGNQHEGFVLENTEMVDFMICKTWEDDSSDEGSSCMFVLPVSETKGQEIDSDRPDEIKVDLLQNGKLVETFTLTKDEYWTKVTKPYPLLDSEGNKYNYEFVEHDVDGYKSEVKIELTENEEGYKAVTHLVKIHNVKTTSVDVEKVWKGKKQDSVTINLLADGEVIDSVKLSEDNEWKHTFKHLPVRNEQAIVYTVEEVAIDGYEVAITGNATDGFVVTNTEIIPPTPIVPAKTSVDVEKVWKGKAQDQVTINLLADGKKVDTVKLSKDNDWKHTFTDLPVVNDIKDEKAIEYTVEEVAIDGYEVAITGNAKEGFVVTNTEIIPPTPIVPAKTSVDVEKVWKGKAQESVTIHLLADGKKVDSVKLSDANDWKHTFTDLPVVNDVKDEQAIVYTVEEVEIDGYEVSIDGNAEDGFVVTNTEIIPVDPEEPTKVEKLPQTGSKTNYMYSLAGLALLLIGGFTFYRNRKKSIENNS